MAESKNQLQQILDDILQDKNTNLTPDNLKQGVTCLGIRGNLQEGIDKLIEAKDNTVDAVGEYIKKDKE